MHDYSIFSSTPKRAIPVMESTPVILVLFFSLITGGIYIPFWFLNRKSELNKLDSDKMLKDNTFIFLAVGFVFSNILSIISSVIDKMALEAGTADALYSASILRLVDSSISLTLGIIVVIQCFKVQSMFRDHFKRKFQFSGLATFFFTIFYLQYKMNKISEMRR